MSCIAYPAGRRRLRAVPGAKFIFLEANGGWLVPWLERLDHHCRKFQWEVTDLSLLPSEYFDASAGSASTLMRPCCALLRSRPSLAPTASSGPVDYPHPDAKFPGVTEELAEALEGSTFEQKRQITSESAIALYGIGR